MYRDIVVFTLPQFSVKKFKFHLVLSYRDKQHMGKESLIYSTHYNTACYTEENKGLNFSWPKIWEKENTVKQYPEWQDMGYKEIKTNSP